MRKDVKITLEESGVSAIEAMQAYAAGKAIQLTTRDSEWLYHEGKTTTVHKENSLDDISSNSITFWTHGFYNIGQVG